MADPAFSFDCDVNQFPSLTWNQLSINRGHLSTAAKRRLQLASQELSDGISLVQTSRAQLPAALAAIQTGMGKAFDAQFDGALDALKVPVNLYTVEAGRKAGNAVHGRVQLSAENGGGICDTLIVAQKDSDARFIFEYGGEGAENALLGCRIRILAQEGSHVSISLVNLLTGEDDHFDSVGASLEDGASVELTELQLGGSKVYSGSCYELRGRAARFDGRLAYLVAKDHRLDVNYVARQSGRDTQSSMQVNGVVSDRGTKTWRGTIDFVKGAADAKGDEQEDVLLLSPAVVNKSLPVILCGEEAVDGRHGASIGRLGSDVLFYMQSRGIDARSAQKIMVSSKIASVSRFVQDTAVEERIQQHLEGAFSE